MADRWFDIDTRVGTVRLHPSSAYTVRLEGDLQYRTPFTFSALLVERDGEWVYDFATGLKENGRYVASGTLDTVMGVVLPKARDWLDANPEEVEAMKARRAVRAVDKLNTDLRRLKMAERFILEEIGRVQNGLPYTEYPLDPFSLTLNDELNRR